MIWRRRTLVPMDEALERLLAEVADVVLDQGGDWDATFAVLRQRYPGEDLIVPDGPSGDLIRAQVLAIMLLNEYEEPGLGPKVIQTRRDRRRRLVEATKFRNWRLRSTG